MTKAIHAAAADTVPNRIRAFVFWCLLLAAGAASGCTVLSSELAQNLQSTGNIFTGPRYCLPMTMMEFRLSVDPEKVQFRVTPGAPRSVPDRARCYHVEYRPAPQYDDLFHVEIGPRGYLKSVSVNTTDQTVEILRNLAKGFGAFGQGLEAAYFPVSDSPVTKDTIDPTDAGAVAKMEEKFSQALRTYALEKQKIICANALKSERPENGKPTIPDLKARIQCEEFKRLAGMRRPISLRFVPFRVSARKIEISEESDGLQYHAAEPKKRPPDTVADCRLGICYRAPEPWELQVAIGEVALPIRDKSGKLVGAELAPEGVQRSLHLVPNRARIVLIDLQRAIFVNKTQSITFDDNGILDTVTVKKDSELLALSSIPIAIIGAIADGLKIRVTVINERINDANASKALLQARAALEKQRLQLESYLVRAQDYSIATPSRVPALSAEYNLGPAPLDREEPIR